MERRQESHNTGLVYEVVLDNMAPELLRTKFPELEVQVTGVQSLLRCSVSSPEQLDALLDQLVSLGLHLDEVHRFCGASREVASYEVRLAGEVRPRLLGHLGGSHRFVSGQTRVRVVGMTTSLHQFLQDCTDGGASIQRVQRLGAER